MSLKIADHLFYGPYPLDKVKLRANQTPAVIAIVCKSGEPWLPTFHLVDVMASPDEGIVVAEHPRRPQWQAAREGELQVYLLDVPKSEGDLDHRRRVADRVRATLEPMRGEISLAGGM